MPGSSADKQKTLIIIGGGAAGFFCAVNAAADNFDLHVIILEKTSKLLSKVKVSGGGRCNVTHDCFDIPELITKYPRGNHFLKKALHQFSTKDTIEWFGETWSKDQGGKGRKNVSGEQFVANNYRLPVSKSE